MLKLSLIIPVYNEENHIRACLDAVANQEVMPDEVIVVDNNCTDRTIEIARKFNFVTVISEKNQGRGYARSAGFDKAKYEILGRIDADSIINPNWTKTVLDNFANDPDLYGVTGLAFTDIIPYTSIIKTKLFSRSYFWFVHAQFNTITMWGANMAIRKSAWEKVKSKVIKDDKIVHEDQDISLWMAAAGQKISVDNQLLISTNGQTYRYLPKFIGYIKLFKSTKKHHQQNRNLDNIKKLGFLNTLPGRIAAIFTGFYMVIVAIILFPLDYLLVRSGILNKRLERTKIT